MGILICALVCCLLPKATRKMDVAQRYVIPCIAVAGAMSFALAFHQYYFDQRLLAVAGIVVSGFGYFWFISRFALLLAVTQGIPCLAWSFAAAFPLRHLLLIAMDAAIPVNWQVMVAIALPLASFAAFEAACAVARKRAQSHADEQGCPSDEARTLFGVPTLPKAPFESKLDERYLTVSVLAIALMLSVVRACSISGMWGGDHTAGLSFADALVSVASMVVAIGLLVYLAVIRVHRYPVTMRFQVGILLVLAGLVVAAVKPWLAPFIHPSILDLIVSTNDPLALVLFWSAVCMAVVSFSAPANRVIGVAGAVYAAASIAWVDIINKVNALDSAMILVAVYLLFAVFMLATWFARHKRLSFEGERVTDKAPLSVAGDHFDSREGDGQEGLVDDEEADASAVLVQALMVRCDELAEECGLSPREKDVLVLLAQGKTGTAIQDELTLAASTVKTHMQHIYAKTGVGDRQQLMDAVLGKRDS
ncbi:MAG: helix-turn-helix transcriptional regulator [Slackia sp.]|nr:helix-turn-helix transcriptional regulator [Slackia sp.]